MHRSSDWPDETARHRDGASQACEDRPTWWHWGFHLSPHLLKRMGERRLTETELRIMLEDSTGYDADVEVGRWIIEARHRAVPWEVVVEPDDTLRIVVVVTAYPVS